MKLANKIKSAIEQGQRNLKQERASKGLVWEPRFFRFELEIFVRFYFMKTLQHAQGQN
jgi:hypothetical protein